MSKKAQGISMNVIVIAAIALLVLVVLSVVFMGRMGVFNKGAAECRNNGGVCADECGKGDAAGFGTEFKEAACSDGKKCCIVG